MINIEDLKKIIEKEIEELERKIKAYTALLEVLEHCESPYIRRRGEEQEVEVMDFVDSTGNTALSLHVGKQSIRLFFTKPVLSKNPYIKYFVHVLQQLSEENPAMKYDIGVEEDYVKTIIATGLTKNEIEELKIAVEYLVKKLGLRHRERETE